MPNFTDLVEPSLANYLYTVKETIVANIAEDSETCIEKFICQATLSEDPVIQDQIIKW